MSDETVPNLPVEHAHEAQGVELVEKIPAYGSVEADAFLARPARAWRDRAERERTDHLRPPGYIWHGGTGWVHRKLTVEGLRNWESYSTANPGIGRIREKLLTPPEAWGRRGPLWRGSKG